MYKPSPPASNAFRSFLSARFARELNHKDCYRGSFCMVEETIRCIKSRCYPGEWMQI
jgi:hypothetical protein